MSCTCKYGGGPDGVCFECKSRRAIHARLKKLEDAKDTADYERGIAEGERRERARVVADLRTHKWHPGGAKGSIQPETAALRYERGEHTKEGA